MIESKEKHRRWGMLSVAVRRPLAFFVANHLIIE